MKLSLLEKIFQNIETHLDLAEAKQKAKLFLQCVVVFAWEEFYPQEDYWIQISKEWDLNVYRESEVIRLYLYCADKSITNTAKFPFFVGGFPLEDLGGVKDNDD